MKRFQFVLAACALLAGPAGALQAFAASPSATNAVACVPSEAILSDSSGRIMSRFSVEIADDEREREIGLMNRTSMPRSAGMLFVYPAAQHVAFWMRNTLIPLDMLFIDATGHVVSVQSMAVPLDETPIPSGAPVRFVLEINGGLAKRLGIGPGAILSHPAIDPTVAQIPCL